MPKPHRRSSATSTTALRLALVATVLLGSSCASDSMPKGERSVDAYAEPRVPPHNTTTTKADPGLSCAAITSRNPELVETFALAAEARRTADDKDIAVEDWYQSAQALQRDIEKRRDLFQTLVCAENVDLDDCIDPVRVHCEGLPFYVDTTRLEARDLTPLEATAMNNDLLGSARNFAEVCCGDFGCTENGVGLPFDGNVATFANISMLADAPSALGDNARASLALTATALESASCTCFLPAPDKQKAFAGFVAQQADGAEGQSAADTKRIAAAIRAGLPEKECPIPGY